MSIKAAKPQSNTLAKTYRPKPYAPLKNSLEYLSDNSDHFKARKEVAFMKLQDKYVYPAIFTYEDGYEIAVTFPDLPGCTTSGVD